MCLNKCKTDYAVIILDLIRDFTPEHQCGTLLVILTDGVLVRI